VKEDVLSDPLYAFFYPYTCICFLNNDKIRRGSIPHPAGVPIKEDSARSTERAFYEDL